MSNPPSCDLCGARADDQPALVALAWTSAAENGRSRHYCVPCSRVHLRALEAKLDPEHW